MIIVEVLSKDAGVAREPRKQSVAQAAQSLFGIGFDPEVARILEEDDKVQKELMRKRWAEEG